MKWLKYILTTIGILILIGMLIPTVSIPSHRSDISASKMQYANYVNALLLFKAEYGDYPDLFDQEGVLNLGESKNAKRFVETMSGRTLSGERRGLHENTQAHMFHSFSESELKQDKQTRRWQIVDYTGNTNVILRIDHDGDGMITVPDGDSTKQIRATVTAYSINESGQVAIQIWD